MECISYDHFRGLDIRVGFVRFVEPVEGSDKLYRCLVEFDEELKTEDWTDPVTGAVYPVRQIVSGIREYISAEELTGKQLLYLVNLEPRTIRGVVSNGMLMAVGDDPIFIVPEKPTSPGAKLR
jgi:tRNA-binding EMAP/Myf-like protein